MPAKAGSKGRGGLGVMSKPNATFVLFFILMRKRLQEEAHLGNNAPSSEPACAGMVRASA